MIEDVERRALAMTVAKFIRPSHVAGGRLVGTVWHTGLGAEVEISAAMPKDLPTDEVMAAAEAGWLVLLPSTTRLGWARG
jgi:hypothetical protein